MPQDRRRGVLAPRDPWSAPVIGRYRVLVQSMLFAVSAAVLAALGIAMAM